MLDYTCRSQACQSFGVWYSVEMLADKIYPFFMGAWLILALASWFFYRCPSVATRRRWHGYLIFNTGMIFGIFILLMSWDWPTFPFVVTFVIPTSGLMIWWSSRKFRFCEECKATLFPPPFENAPDYCPKCGTNLHPSPCA